MKRLRVGPHLDREAGPNAVLRVVNECSVDPTWHARIALMTSMASEEKCFVPYSFLVTFPAGDSRLPLPPSIPPDDQLYL